MKSKFRTLGQARKAHPHKFVLKTGSNGRNLCRYCNTEVTPPRKTYCSGKPTQYRRKKIDGVWGRMVYEPGSGCVHEWMIRSGGRYARNAVFDRDNGICAQCGHQELRYGAWEADHIHEVAGGTEVFNQPSDVAGLEDYQTLCTPCHKAKTKAFLGRRAAERKAQRQLAQEAPVVAEGAHSDATGNDGKVAPSGNNTRASTKKPR